MRSAMRYFRTLGLCVCLGVLTLLLVSCGESTKSEEEIRADIPAEVRSITVDGEERVLDIQEMTVDKRRLEEDGKRELVYCTVRLGDGIYEAQVRYALEYLYYDQGGWVLENADLMDEKNLRLELTDGPPAAVAEEFLSGQYETYTLRETRQESDRGFVCTYDVTGTAEGTEYAQKDEETGEYTLALDLAAEFEGTVSLYLGLAQWSWDSYAWQVSLRDKTLGWVAGVSEETALENARMYYPSAQYLSQAMEEDGAAQAFLFEVAESDACRTVTGTLCLRYKMDYMDEDGTYYNNTHMLVEKDRSALTTDWQIDGKWSGTFLQKGEHSYTYCPVTFTIDAVTDSEILFSGGYCNVDHVYSLDELDPPDEYSLESLRVPYVQEEDGSLSLELEYSGGHTFRVFVTDQGIWGIYPWLSYERAEFSR